jgi:hypothetical protein
MDAKIFKEISTRGRVAFAICCLENVIKKQNLVQNDESEKTILQQLWHFTTDNMALWEMQIGELIPFVIMNDISYEYIDDFEFFSPIICGKFQAYYKKCHKYTLDIINLIYDLGRTNLYITINKDELKEASLPYLQKIIDLMIENDVLLPDINLFIKFSITENNGWGKVFTRNDIFEN